MNNQSWFLWAIPLVGLTLSGCMEAMRRPADGAVPKWGAPAPVATAVDSPAVPAAEAKLALMDGGAPSEDVPPVIVQVYPERNRTQRQRIKQVNEYVLWCIENRMWQEARRHLEQAVQNDSLAASLHNNLGIVYEQLGLEDEARSAYKAARRLKPEREAYQTNLSLLERRYARFDKSVTAASPGDSTRKSPADDTEQILPDGHQGLDPSLGASP